MAVLCAHANIPIAFYDKLSPAIRRQFKNSKVVAQYHLASTKTMCVLNGAVAPSLISDLLAKMKTNAFSLMIDGSNANGLKKMNPIIVQIFDGNCIKTCVLQLARLQRQSLTAWMAG